jgi:hypothetical protein
VNDQNTTRHEIVTGYLMIETVVPLGPDCGTPAGVLGVHTMAGINRGLRTALAI